MITNAQVYPMRGPRGGFNPVAGAKLPPSVLTQNVVDRLARLNGAVRRLREWHIRVLETDVSGARPRVRIERAPSTSIAALLDAASPRQYLPARAGRREARCLLDDVLICWEETL